MSRVRSIDPIFVVSDLPRAISHYEKLGFHTSSYDEGYAFAERDEVSIHLASAGGEEAFVDPDRVGRAAAYLHVDDADALAEEWRRSGVDFDGPKDVAWGQREGSHQDPDGNVIRFGSPLRR